jgi:RHS repeat-associated protein
VRDLVNWSGAVQDHLDYTGFGVPTESNPANGSRFGYDGLLTQTLTGYDIALYRVYNPSTGTWQTLDPISFAAGQANLYGFVGNDPTNATDPTGLEQLRERRTRTLTAAQEAATKTEGRWSADWYYKNVLHLDYYDWSSLWSQETKEYTEYQRGCKGLANIRLGLPYAMWRTTSAEQCFKTYEEAEKYANSLPSKRGKAVRMMAFILDERKIPAKKWEEMKGGFTRPQDIIDIRYHKDMLTLHQPTKGNSGWFWESMNLAYTDATDDTPIEVIHRPFDWVMPDKLNDMTRYNYVMFAVVYVDQSSMLPPATSYGTK